MNKVFFVFIFLANNGNLMMDFFLEEYPHDGFNQGKEVAKSRSLRNETNK